jgi:signal transduction histidine kinase
MLYEWLTIIAGVVGLLAGVIITLVISRLVKGKKAKKEKKEGDQSQHATQWNYLDSQRLQEVYKLLTNLTATLSYQRVIDKALDYSVSALSYPDDHSADHLVSAVLLFMSEGGETVLHIAASRRLTRSDLRDTFPAQQGILKNTIDEGASLLTHTIAQDPELGRIYAFQSCKSAYCTPLRHGLDTFGVLLYAHPERDYFTVEHREILDIIANQAMVAIQNARLYHDLEQEKERMIETQEDARKKLARDLHDGPTQSVAAIAMRVNFARRLIERDTGAAAEELYKIEDLARRTTKEIRHMLFTLRPLVLESQGLNAALKSMAEKMKETFEQNVLLDIDPGVEKEIEMGKQGVIFAIVEEAVNNARKYAQAEQIWVRLKPIQKDIAVLEIQDNGVGFDVGKVDASYETRGSLGMINMRERTDLVNGIFHIDSKIGKGTRIQVVIPLTEEATERLHRGV